MGFRIVKGTNKIVPLDMIILYVLKQIHKLKQQNH